MEYNFLRKACGLNMNRTQIKSLCKAQDAKTLSQYNLSIGKGGMTRRDYRLLYSDSHYSATVAEFDDNARNWKWM